METVDEEFLKATLDFIDRAAQEKKPFFAWFNSSRMHTGPPQARVAGKTVLASTRMAWSSMTAKSASC